MHVTSTSCRSIKYAALVGCLVLMAGCSTQPVSTAEASPVPNERIVDRQFLQPASGTGEVTVKRDSGLAGSACPVRVYVDGKPMADLKTAEKVVLHLPAGDHILSAWPTGLCGGGMAEVKADVKAGGQSAFRVRYGGGGDFSISATAF